MVYATDIIGKLVMSSLYIIYYTLTVTKRVERRKMNDLREEIGMQLSAMGR